MPTAAAATVRGSTKWRTCGASIAVRSDTATAKQLRDRPSGETVTPQLATSRRWPGRLTSSPRSAAVDFVLQSNKYYFACARRTRSARSGRTSPRQR